GSGYLDDYNVQLINDGDRTLAVNCSDINHRAGVELARFSPLGLWVNGALAFASDRNVKAGFAPVDSQAILEKVPALPITRWHYTTDPATPHLGPVAQDFHAAFSLGADEKHIATVDADGIALAAIQGLNQKLEAKSRDLEIRTRRLEDQNAELKQRNDSLEKR